MILNIADVAFWVFVAASVGLGIWCWKQEVKRDKDNWENFK